MVHLIGPGTIKLDNGQPCFRTADQPPLRLHLRTLRSIHCYGPVGFSDLVWKAITNARVDVVWFSRTGQRMYGRTGYADSPHVMLRIRQLRFCDDQQNCLPAQRWLATEKLASLQLATRTFQRHGQAGAVSPTVFDDIIRRVGQATCLPTLLGLEGQATNLWYQALGAAIPRTFDFPGRVRRPPTDPVNALLSLGATFLMQRTVARIEAAGLEPTVGFYHQYRAGRPSLACDLIEPLRVDFVDRWVVAMLAKKIVQPGDFATGTKGTRLTPAAFPRILDAWENRRLAEGLFDRIDGLIATFVRWMGGQQ